MEARLGSCDTSELILWDSVFEERMRREKKREMGNGLVWRNGKPESQISFKLFIV
jgi:hypothetical protein